MVASPDNQERPSRRNSMANVPACVVVGASVRAFAASAAKAGWIVYAVDLFSDTDLAAVAAASVRLGPAGSGPYPEGIPEAVAALPSGPVVFTGAVENHPHVLAAIAAMRPLAGCSPAAVSAVRDPALLARIVRDIGFAFPDTVTSPHGVPRDGNWLVKPAGSAGGHGVRAWTSTDVDHGPDTSIWQRRIRGDEWSASFVAAAGVATCFGVSRPLVGIAWCGGRRFAYCGSVDVPLDTVPDRLRRSFESLGPAIASAFGLTGLFGVDTIIDGASRLHVLEVNPRPTASMELVERATGRSMAATHLAAYGLGREPPRAPAAAGVWAKAIVYASRSRPVPPVIPRIAAAAEDWTREDGIAAVADVPGDDALTPPGGPLVTVFAHGPTADAAVATLRGRVLAVRRAVTRGITPQAASSAAPRPPRARTA